MSLKSSSYELKERLFELNNLIDIGENHKDVLENIIENDIMAISIILSDEGLIRRIKKELYKIKILFLKDYSNGDYEVFKKYKKLPEGQWDFLTNNQKEIIGFLEKGYKSSLQSYFENRGDMMIIRKTINNFISNNIKNKESINDLNKVRNYLMNNYSYQDTLYNLGLNPAVGEDGFLKLNKLKLNESGRLY